MVAPVTDFSTYRTFTGRLEDQRLRSRTPAAALEEMTEPEQRNELLGREQARARAPKKPIA
jgi:hypothetical protein